MSNRVSENKTRFYVCGRCKTPIHSKVNDEFTIPCPDCGYYHKDRDYHDVPSEVKINLGKY